MSEDGILLIEDDESGRMLSTTNLRRAGYLVDEAEDGRKGVELFDPIRHRVVITDLKMPNASGMEVLAHVLDASPTTPVIMITAYGSIELAVEAVKRGAFDFIAKPFNRDQLFLAVDRALEKRRLEEEARSLRNQIAGIEREIVYASDRMRVLVEMVDRIARTEVPVLITGEPGVGKELLARRIHARSARSAGPFVSVSCAAIGPEELETELFGGERGGCPCMGKLHQVDGGTLHLDEFVELSTAHQRKLLQVLDDAELEVPGGARRRLDVRLVCATSSDPRGAAASGDLRKDLLRRLDVVELSVPPLRTRPEDIRPLAQHFVRRLMQRDALTEEVATALESRPWLGNVRELENACERMVTLAPGDALRVADLPPPVPRGEARGSETGLGEWPPLPEDGLSLVDLEKQLIERVLELKGGNITHAAAYLRVPRHVLAYRMEKYGLR